MNANETREIHKCTAEYQESHNLSDEEMVNSIEFGSLFRDWTDEEREAAVLWLESGEEGA